LLACRNGWRRHCIELGKLNFRVETEREMIDDGNQTRERDT